MTTFSYDPFDDRACRVCGCTETNACVDRKHGACWWVEDDLCSHCQMKGRRRGYVLFGLWVLSIAVLGALLFFGEGHG